MLNYGKDWYYASSRLVGSVVRLDNYPVIVQDVGNKECLVRKLGQHHLFTTETNNLDINPLPLGYVNTSSGLNYSVRMPARKYRQGLRAETFYTKALKGYRIKFDSPDLVPTIRGKFPSLEECLNSLFNDEQELIAFNRHWAVSKVKGGKATKLWYKTDHVGHLVLNKKNYVDTNLYENCAYLKETLDGVLNNV